MSSIQANLPPFEVGDGENVSKMWSRWISQFLVYLRATALDREDDERKVALLLTLGGTKLFDLVYSLEVDTSKITLEGLIKILNDHYVPKNLTVERHRFLTCVQEKTETLDKYVSRLKSLSINCELGTLEDDLTKDVMICGIRNAKLKERLLEEASLTLTKAIEMSKAFELSNSTTHSQKAVDTKDAPPDKISHQGKSSKNQRSTTNDVVGRLTFSLIDQKNHVSEQIKISESDEQFQKFARFILEEYFSTKNADWEAWTSIYEVLAKDMSDEQRMKKFVDFVYEKVIDEPHLSAMYAQLCSCLQLIKVQLVEDKVGEVTPQRVYFRKVLLLKCQYEFEKTKEDELDIDARQKQIAETKDQDKRKELLLAFEEDERKIRIKSVGLIRFLGELFKKNMLTPYIMHQCITVLIEKTDEESIECLCKVLTTIGKDLESKSTGGEFNNYFATMKKLSHKSPDSKISSRIRFMLQDVIELRANKWIPRRDENKPKTIEQIQKDAEKETFMESFQSSMSSNMNRGNRNDDRRRTQKNQVSEDGWHNVNKTRSSNYTLERNMLSRLEPENLLRKPGQFNQWSMGAKHQNTENKNFTSANKFDILQLLEDRKLPLYGSSGQKGATPLPSIDKERAIAGVKVMRGSESRESSRSRYGSSPVTSISKEEKVREPEPKPQEEMTEELDEQLSRSTRLVIDEYFSNKNSDEAYESIQDVFAATNRLKIFIEKSLSHVTENTNAEKRARFANLLVILIKDKKLLPKKDVIEGFSKIMDNEDLITDLPLMWQYLAQLLAPLIAQEALDFQDFKLASKQIAKENVSKLLVEIITFLIKDKGPCWISTQWESCHMNIKDFVPDNENIDKFITDKKLGFLTGSAEYPLQPDESLTCEEIEEKLLKFLKNDTNKAIDHSCDWIKANVSNKTKGTTLVKALTRASIKGSLVMEKFHGNQFEEIFCGNAFKENIRLIKKYVDNDENYELACLYAAQHLLANEIVPPPTVIQEIFESLYTSGTISFAGFMKWKETKMSEENEVGKGVLLSVLSSFFVMLSENSNDTEEES